MDTVRKPLRSLAVALGITLSGFALGVPAPVAADHIRGIRVTVTNVDSTTRTVEVDVTGYTQIEEELEEAEGNPTELEYIYEEVESGLYLENEPAIAWGEGEVQENTTLEFVDVTGGRARYRSSFSHTYESTAPQQTITVRTACCGGPEVGLEEEAPGPVGNPFPITDEGALEYYGTPNLVSYFTNAALVIFQPSVLEIPTASTVGLGLLSVLLGFAGFWLLRR